MFDSFDEVYILTFEEYFIKKYMFNHTYEEFPFLLTDEFFSNIVSHEFFEHVEYLYLQMRRYFKENDKSFKIIGHLFAALLHRYKESCFHDEPVNIDSQMIHSFKKLLDSHYQGLVNGAEDKIFQVQDYANALGFHPSYFGAMIKVKTGKSASRWIAEKTISQSKLLLRNQSISIKEISYQLGFSVPGHFSSYFKKHTGVSPKEYRRNFDS
ncbi:helix-turn-helix domain-containing protein [Chryseobacterium sp. MEBOG07]|uniref:helix-turn-helix domain-containing protein n=1 Tax=Chryseobacterium sp. MEBOG07 TaxID=2879939 RepID=UPI001F17AA9B|nr:AraC family transcriptional regulator [Chryseobacterium sp. MEBOG07]UKB78301.1 AraC family transcriptional regulator [Chryseobacterium sp. MEBOG07]